MTLSRKNRFHTGKSSTFPPDVYEGEPLRSETLVRLPRATLAFHLWDTCTAREPYLRRTTEQLNHRFSMPDPALQPDYLKTFFCFHRRTTLLRINQP